MGRQNNLHKAVTRSWFTPGGAEDPVTRALAAQDKDAKIAERSRVDIRRGNLPNGWRI